MPSNLSFDQIEAALDARQALVEAIHPLVRRAKQHKDLSLMLLESRKPGLEVRDVELDAFLRSSDAPEMLKHEIGGFVGHGTSAYHSASAPEMISISSFVIMAWRERL